MSPAGRCPMTDNSEAITALETIRNSGATMVRTGDVTVQYSQTAVQQALRTLRSQDDTQRSRRPTACQIKLT